MPKVTEIANGKGERDPKLLVASLSSLSFQLFCPLLKAKLLSCTLASCGQLGPEPDPEPRPEPVLGLSLYSTWPGGRALNGALRQGRTPQSLDCLLTNREVLGTKVRKAGSHPKKARSWGSRSLGIGQNGLKSWQTDPTGTLSLAPQPVLVPVSQVARDKLKLQQGTPHPDGVLGPGVPTAYPTCNPETQLESSRWR